MKRNMMNDGDATDFSCIAADFMVEEKREALEHEGLI